MHSVQKKSQTETSVFTRTDLKKVKLLNQFIRPEMPKMPFSQNFAALSVPRPILALDQHYTSTMIIYDNYF